MIGLATYGYNIMRVLGVKCTHITPSRYAIECAAVQVVHLSVKMTLVAHTVAVVAGHRHTDVRQVWCPHTATPPPLLAQDRPLLHAQLALFVTYLFLDVHVALFCAGVSAQSLLHLS